jgi:hypothetical protein
MNTWPPTPATALSDAEKRAYRYLLYMATIEIRSLCQSRGSASHNPIAIWRQYHRSRAAGAVADWLHNLAQSSADDFAGFDPKWFWKEYAGLKLRYPPMLYDYRKVFEKELNAANMQDEKGDKEN